MKKKNGFLSIIVMTLLSFACFCAALISPILAKYAVETDAPYNGNVDLDYTVSSVFEVRNQEELFAAINHGYSYVRISEEVKNPMIVTMDSETLHSDLILDLNGKEIQRNGHTPILTINPSVRLTITDTSSDQKGGLYNPVGSVFSINGGTLTIVSGKFESGPRYSEYYMYNKDIANDVMTTVAKTAREVTFYNKDGVFSTKKAPIINPYTTGSASNGDFYTHGNLYFDQTVTPSKSDLTIMEDTYCYYRVGKTELTGQLAIAETEASWYYCYYVNENDYAYVSEATIGDTIPDGLQLITVYGYEKTIETAESKTNVEDYYAAIKLKHGSLDVLEGGFYSYFGAPTTACVDAVSGNLSIKEGRFSSRIPDAVSTNTAARSEDAEAFDTNYFTNYKWANTENEGGARARTGESYCILNMGDAKVTIGSGQFYSSNNNIVCMSDIEDDFNQDGEEILGANGVLTINGGTFNQTLIADGRLHTEHYDEAAAIYMQAGILNINKATVTVDGNFVQGVRMVDGELNLTDSMVYVRGNSAYGIYSTAQSIEEDNPMGDHGTARIHVTDTNFDLTNGTLQTGIYASRGMVHIRGINKNPRFDIAGDRSVGVYATHSGMIISDNYDYELSGAYSAGIYSAGGTVRINKGNIILDSNVSCYGVYVAPDGSANNGADSTTQPDGSTEIAANNLELNDAVIKVGYDNHANKVTKGSGTGTIVASVGVFFTALKSESEILLNRSEIYSDEIGIALNEGHLRVTGGGVIKTNKGSAIAIAGGDLTFEHSEIAGVKYTYTVESYNTTQSASDNTYNMTLPTLNEDGTIGSVDYQNTDGIYIQGGSFVCNGLLNLTHTGLQNKTNYSDYTGLKMTSYAVHVVGGSIQMLKGSITANAGGGICASGVEGGTSGNIILGEANVSGNTITVRTTGTQKGSAYNGVGAQYTPSTWQNYKSINGGNAVEVNGGNIDIYYGEYTAAFGNGVAAKGSGTITIHGGKFTGNMTGVTGKSGPAAYYGLKVIGGAEVNIYDGTFDGGNGGAFVTGIDNFDANNLKPIVAAGQKEATVFIYAGTFGNPNSVDGFNIYDYSNVVFGADSQGDASKILIHGKDATIATNKLSDGQYGKDWVSDYLDSTVRIYYGDYDGSYDANGDGDTKDSGERASSQHGIYNANASIIVYNFDLGLTVLIEDYYSSEVTHEGRGNNTAEYY